MKIPKLLLPAVVVIGVIIFQSLFRIEILKSEKEEKSLKNENEKN